MKRLTSFIIATIVAFSLLAYSGVVRADMDDLNSVSSSEVEYVLECCDNFQASIQGEIGPIKASLSPEETYGP